MARLRKGIAGERLGAVRAVAVERPADLRFEQLVADLTGRVRTKLPVYGLQALRLAGRIERLAAPAIAALQAESDAHTLAVQSILRGEGGAAA